MVRIGKSARTLILVMGVLVLIAIVFLQRFYSEKNSSVDPRIRPARELYKKYNSFAAANQFDSVLALMDTIEAIYRSTDHYANSFEVGVLYNNRAAAWLTAGLFGESVTGPGRDSLLLKAEKAVRKSIRIYESWKDEYMHLDESQLRNLLSGSFMKGLNGMNSEESERFFRTRITEIVEAQTEIDRRLSVSYTNLGMVCRHNEKYDSAAINYKKALELWERNLTAKNNLNTLFGQPHIKRNFIERLFPPERIK